MSDASKKDPMNYNFSVVSRLSDFFTLDTFMRDGRDFIERGELIKKACETNGTLADYKKAEGSVDPRDFRFNESVSQELRANFLLQTEATDNFEDMMAILDEYMPAITKKGQWRILRDCIYEAEERFKKTKILFPCPVKGYDKGTPRKLTQEEKDRWGLHDEDFYVDERHDWHDLVAMKDLCLRLSEGLSIIESYNLCIGFFAKYMPEIRKTGYDVLYLNVGVGSIDNIGLLKLPYSVNGYSPSDVAHSMAYLQVIESGILPLQLYVCVDGGVGAGSKDYIFNYEDQDMWIKNDKVVRAAECYLLNVTPNGGFIKTTRLYFYPYEPTEVNPYYQHGSVITGVHDITHHSCVSNDNFQGYNKPLDEQREVENKDWKAFFYNEWKEFTLTTEGDCQYEPASVAGLLLDAPKGEDYMYFRKIFMKNDDEKIFNILKSVYAENSFTLLKWMHKYDHKKTEENLSRPLQIDIEAKRRNIAEDICTIARRFSLKDYLDGEMFDTDSKDCTWRTLAKSMKYKDNVSLAFHVARAKEKQAA